MTPTSEEYKTFSILGCALIEWIVFLALTLPVLLLVYQGLGCVSRLYHVCGYCAL